MFDIVDIDVAKEDGIPSRASEYWSWFVIAVFFLIPIDIITTTFAVSEYGISGEKNWIMAALLQSEWYVFISVNLLASLAAVAMFYGIMQMGEKTPQRFRRAYYIVVDIWLGVLISVGLAIFANNTTTIILGKSLLTFI